MEIIARSTYVTVIIHWWTCSKRQGLGGCIDQLKGCRHREKKV